MNCKGNVTVNYSFLFYSVFSLLCRFFMGVEWSGLMIAKLKNVILHEVLCRHFAVRTEEYQGPRVA